MKVTYLFGNTGTHKSTYARYITDSSQGVILDDDALYYAISNNKWDLYFKENIGYAVTDMIDEMIKALWMRRYTGTVTVSSLIYPVDHFLATTNRSEIQSYVVVTGNGDKKASMEHRKTTDRNHAMSEWESVYDAHVEDIKDTIKSKFIEKHIGKSHVLHLTNPLDLVNSKIELDAFMEVNGYALT